jgi:hypothetical protein
MITQREDLPRRQSHARAFVNFQKSHQRMRWSARPTISNEVRSFCDRFNALTDRASQDVTLSLSP